VARLLVPSTLFAVTVASSRAGADQPGKFVPQGFPHNKVHNCIGGVGAIDPGPYGNMTNFLSPLDPIFYLHHANMDRLWDVWTRKQLNQGLQIMPPPGEARDAFMTEPFRFFVQADGEFAGTKRAADFFNTQAFDYDYVGEGAGALQSAALAVKAAGPATLVRGKRRGAAVSVSLPGTIRGQLGATVPPALIAEVTVERPRGLHNTREFDVLVNAPAGVETVDANSPYYVGTVSFFGPPMTGMDHTHPTTFAVPLPQRLNLLKAGAADASGSTALEFRLVASTGQAAEAIPVLDAAVLVVP
jgi:tyrosinase